MQFAISTAIVALAALVGGVVSETHTVTLTNRCGPGSGTPLLIQGPTVLLTGNGSHTVSGPLDSTIAYLQTGNCLFNGENCTIVELALENLADRGSGSLVDITISPPHAFSVPTGFRYFGGCDGQGASCGGPGSACQTTPVSCQADNVSLSITFCGQ